MNLGAPVTSNDCLPTCKVPAGVVDQAAILYLENGGEKALITDPQNIGRALKGETGTKIVR